MNNIIIFGASGHAKVIIDIIQKENKYKIIGLLDPAFKVNDKIAGYPILGEDKDISELYKKHSLMGAIVAIGDNFIRSKVVAKIKKKSPNLTFISAIHPNSSIGIEVFIGEGTVIMSGVSINSSTSIGHFCILNTNSSLDHDSTLENFTSIAPGVKTGSNCYIEEYSSINIGATLINGIHIGKQSIIGASSLILKSVNSFSVVYGVPAKFIRTRKEGEKYF
ncbi:MAG: transferase [Candidatus Cloacimonadota bacterium]|nr:MAG: transferase [Candidatus Cloacimonadota bacterium]